MTVESATGTGTNVGKMVLFMKATSSDPSGYGPAGFNTRDRRMFSGADFESYNWQRLGGSKYQIVLNYAAGNTDEFTLTAHTADSGTYTATGGGGGNAGAYKIIGLPLSDGPRISPGSDNQVAAFPDKLNKNQILNNQFSGNTDIEWLFDVQAGDPEFYMFSASGSGSSDDGLYVGRVNQAGERIEQVKLPTNDLSSAGITQAAAVNTWGNAGQKPYSGVEGQQRIRYNEVTREYTLTTGATSVYAADSSGFRRASYTSGYQGAIGRKTGVYLTKDLMFTAEKGALTLKDGNGQASLAPLTALADGGVEVASMYVFSAAWLAELDQNITR